MERFAAVVSSRRAAPAPAPGPDEEVKGKGNEKGKGKVTAEDEAYLRIQLEEIVVVKNEDVTSFAGACAPGEAAAGAPAGSSAATAAAAAARGALSTTVGWIAGSK
ncbi:hypothetical protein BAE44_0007675 [Dichanthelium oligosanthes]|uniref:Uncharacterized protein n=1 Tax=Dichanthelium oligosanthes TaxID=888268 RepID=A0A1E5W1T5_9POAL|nr:hypothetical protein BAE44_0007675 [Dichanthelium oligosanthes]